MKLKDKVIFARLILRESVRSFAENNSLQTAATLAYYGFFSLIPLLLSVLILLSHFTISSQAVSAAIESVISQFLPKSSDVILKEIYALARQKAWGVFSVIVLLWVVTPFASSIRNAFRGVFKADRKSHFLKSKLFDFAAVLALLVLFVLLVVGKIAYSLLQTRVLKERAWVGSDFASLLVSLLAAVAFILFFDLVFCPVRLTWGQRLAGAAATILLLFIIRPAFGLVLKFNPNYGYAFGSLKAVFLLTVWIYYSFLAILFGTEIMANIRRREALLLKGLLGSAALPPALPGGLLKKFLRRYTQRELVFKEGEAGGEMFYIRSGQVEVSKGGKPVRVLGEGEYFGEMSMLLDEPRTATITAASAETYLVAISRDNFALILRENPEVVKSILKTMAQRLKQTTQLWGQA